MSVEPATDSEISDMAVMTWSPPDVQQKWESLLARVEADGSEIDRLRHLLNVDRSFQIIELVEWLVLDRLLARGVTTFEGRLVPMSAFASEMMSTLPDWFIERHTKSPEESSP